MEGMRQIADAYYKRSDGFNQEKVKEFFSKLDRDGDGRVSLVDFKTALKNSFTCTDDVFRQLDVDQKGYLNITDSRVVYYMEKIIGMCRCDGCSACLYGMYFSCKQCLGNGDATFDLCCDCYSKGVDHRHPTAEMVDHHSLVRLLRKCTNDEKIRQTQMKMEGMRDIANAYYQRSDAAEKKRVQEFFNKMDTNHDGKISQNDVEELLQNNQISNVKIMFQQLDVNQDGYLNLLESVVLYYMEKIGMSRCDGCCAHLYGMHFSCQQCLGKENNTFNLCCDCYTKGVDHHHPTTDLLDSHSLCRLLVTRATAEENGESQRKREMEELQEIAMAYFSAGSENVQALARNFYASMDIDGNGSVDLERYLKFMKQEGYSEMSNPEIFQELCDGGAGLSFENGMMLYYIINSGRPICNGCDKLIPGTYFSCIKCMATPKRAFNLCKACYKDRKCTHSHNGQDAPLFDNYTLLQFKMDTSRSSVSETGVTGNSHEYTSNPTMAIMVAPPKESSNMVVSSTVRAVAKVTTVGITAAAWGGCTIM